MRPSTIRSIINDPVFLERSLGAFLWSALILVLLTNSPI